MVDVLGQHAAVYIGQAESIAGIRGRNATHTGLLLLLAVQCGGVVCW